MELLLNLAWLLLALPAYWLWRGSVGARGRRNFTALQCSLVLGCVLVLLFPVISASDDLHAMRAEIEEPATSKRAVRAGSDKSSAWMNRLQSPPAMTASATWLRPGEAGPLEVSAVSLWLPTAIWDRHAGRAPPVTLLG